MSGLFSGIFRGRIVIVGAGNPLKGDDGFGPALIEKLRGRTKLPLIDAGPTVENYTRNIIREKPDTVLIADAAHMGLEPGEYRILKPEEIIKTGFTTHDISLKMFFEYLESETGADIYILGLQPESVSFGRDMSERAIKALKEICSLILEAEAETGPPDSDQAGR